MIALALAGMARAMKCKIARRWEATGKTGARVAYIGAVLEGLGPAGNDCFLRRAVVHCVCLSAVSRLALADSAPPRCTHSNAISARLLKYLPSLGLFAKPTPIGDRRVRASCRSIVNSPPSRARYGTVNSQVTQCWHDGRLASRVRLSWGREADSAQSARP